MPAGKVFKNLYKYINRWHNTLPSSLKNFQVRKVFSYKKSFTNSKTTIANQLFLYYGRFTA